MSDNVHEHTNESGNFSERYNAFRNAFEETEGWEYRNGNYHMVTDTMTISASFSPDTGCIEVAMNNRNGMNITGTGSDSNQAFQNFARHVAHAFNGDKQETTMKM